MLVDHVKNVLPTFPLLEVLKTSCFNKTNGQAFRSAEVQKEKICIFSHLLVTSSYVFFVITLEPNEVLTSSAPRNDRLNLIFVKSFYVNSRKLARNG